MATPFDEWAYEDDIGFEDIVEYVGPEENRKKVEREIARLMSRFIKGSSVEVDWSLARCVGAVAFEGEDPDIWHCPGDTKPSAVAADYCYECPIRLDCLRFACESSERYGMWGGIPENLRAGKGDGHDRSIAPYEYEKLAVLSNVYDVTSKKYRYHRERLKDWTPGQEYHDENFSRWLIKKDDNDPVD